MLRWYLEFGELDRELFPCLDNSVRVWARRCARGDAVAGLPWLAPADGGWNAYSWSWRPEATMYPEKCVTVNTADWFNKLTPTLSSSVTLRTFLSSGK